MKDFTAFKALVALQHAQQELAEKTFWLAFVMGSVSAAAAFFIRRFASRVVRISKSSR